MKFEKIIYKRIEELKEYESNPRENEKAIDYVAQSIRRFGFKVPIVVDSNNIIVCGHTRIKASRKIGLEQVPCIIADDLTPEEIKAFRLADNKVSEFSEWDTQLLDKELDELKSWNVSMSEFGFDFNFDIDEEKETKEDNFEIEIDEEKETRVKRGQLWKLGNHFLLCGDSTNKNDVEKLMQGNKADMIFADAPYGMKKEKDGVLNDNLNFDDLLEFNKKWITLSFEVIKDVGSWYCWGIDEPLMDIYSEILKPMQRENKITFRNLITWDKGHGQGQNAEEFRMYPIADEKCLFVMKGVQGFNTNADNYFEGWETIRLYLEQEIKKINEPDKKIANSLGFKDGRTVNHWWNKSQWTFPTEENYNKLRDYAKKKNIIILKKEYDEIKKEYDEIKKEYDEIKKEYYSSRAYFDNTHDNMNNVWKFARTSKEERELTGGHATPKPLALCGRAIKSSSREKDIVVDFFGGSGSTLIACEQLNRKCFMLELSEQYCDVIIARWETLTGNKAELIEVDNGEER